MNKIDEKLKEIRRLFGDLSLNEIRIITALLQMRVKVLSVKDGVIVISAGGGVRMERKYEFKQSSIVCPTGILNPWEFKYTVQLASVGLKLELHPNSILKESESPADSCLFSLVIV